MSGFDDGLFDDGVFDDDLFDSGLPPGIGHRRHGGKNAAIYIDDTAAGTQAVGTLTLTLVPSLNSWAFDSSHGLVDVTTYNDLTRRYLPTLADATGTIGGFLDFGVLGILNYVMQAETERGLMIFPDVLNNPDTFLSGHAFFTGKTGGAETTAVTIDIAYAAGPKGLAWTHP